MIYILLYFLIGSIVALCGEKIMLKSYDEYVSTHIMKPKEEKYLLFIAYASMVCLWPVMFVPTKKKKGDNND